MLRHLLPLLLWPSVLLGQAPDRQGVEFFEQKIRPVLVQHCYACHSTEAREKKKLQANLLLDSQEGLLNGGDSGPALVKGKSAESLLIKALKYEDFEMPPTGKLSDEIIADFAKWIDLAHPIRVKADHPPRPSGRSTWRRDASSGRSNRCETSRRPR